MYMVVVLEPASQPACMCDECVNFSLCVIMVFEGSDTQAANIDKYRHKHIFVVSKVHWIVNIE